MADARYNPIYSELVSDESDILGILAYSVYKRQKIEFIQSFKPRDASKNVGEAASARQKQAKKRSLQIVNEHSEPVFNAAMATQVVFRGGLKTGQNPADTDLTPFNDLSNSASQLENYRNQANQMAQRFLDYSLQNQAEELAGHYAVQTSEEIRRSRPGFWFGVSQSVIGSVVFVLLLGSLVFFAWSLNQGPRQVIEQVFNVQIIDRTVNFSKPSLANEL